MGKFCLKVSVIIPAYNAENDRIIYKAFPFPVG